MFVVTKTGGKQYRAKEGDVLEIEKIEVEQGKKVTFDEVLLVEDDDKVLIGQPFVETAAVTAVVLDNFKDDKVIVFKKKRRKQYKIKTGHRQQLTRIKIEKIENRQPRSQPQRPSRRRKRKRWRKKWQRRHLQQRLPLPRRPLPLPGGLLPKRKPLPRRPRRQRPQKKRPRSLSPRPTQNPRLRPNPSPRQPRRPKR
jgi:large subunit ribosomal protein L21